MILNKKTYAQSIHGTRHDYCEIIVYLKKQTKLSGDFTYFMDQEFYDAINKVTDEFIRKKEKRLRKK